MDRAIARFADGVNDYRPIWPVIEDEFYAQEKDQFKSQGAEGGARWAPLTEEYAEYKEVRWPGKPILERTGDLVRSLTLPNDPNAVRIEERKTLTLGSRIPYALFHQMGTRTPMPAREEIRLTEAWKRTAMQHIQTYLVQMARQYGFRTGAAEAGFAWRMRKMPVGASRWGGWWQ